MNPNPPLTYLKKVIQTSRSLPSDFIHLIYPEYCLICNKELSKNQKKICLLCFNDLAFTHFENYKDPTSLEELFWGRCKIENSYALFYFEKGKETS